MTGRTKPRSKRPRLPVGERIVRAWFDTVINPLLDGLAWEQARLEAKNWTWQFRPGHLESIHPLHQMISPAAIDNLEQFLRFYPDLSERKQDHDGQVAQLFVACKGLQHALEDSSELSETYGRVTSEAALRELGTDLTSLFETASPDEHLSILAQYIVN